MKKLESLKLDKFKDYALTREQMFRLNGGGMATHAGNTCDKVQIKPGEFKNMNFDYGYDAVRIGDDGKTFITYHNRTCYRDICEQPSTYFK